MFTESQLTAYALNELPESERLAVERYLLDHPEARAEVEQTRHLAALLTADLATEAAPVAVAEPVFVTTRRSRVYTWMALAASVMVAVGLVGNAVKENDRQYAKDTTNYITVHGKPVSRPDLRSFARHPDLTNPDIGLDSEIKQAVEVDVERQNHLLALRTAIAEEPLGLPTTATPMDVLAQAGKGSTGDIGNLGGTVRTAPRMRVNPAVTSGDAKAAASKEFKDKTAGIPYRVAAESEKIHQGYSVDPSNFSRFPVLEENAFTKVEGQNALSTFGVDVDTASYSIMRKFLAQNQLPPANAVRLEEMVNYFPYRDPAPTGADPYGVTIELAECPWQPKHRLARIGLKAKPIDFKNRPASNLVFLIDVSGSMMPEERLPLVKKSLKLLVDQLSENDRVALVVYASGTGIVLDSTSASKKTEILEALERLGAGGSTNGSGGIQLAYEVAIRNFIPNGTNRVILCTDGDWNVGTTSTAALISLIEEKRKSNVFLSVFGFGNRRDEMMVNLAGKGNGNYAYIDSLKEARKALVEQLGGTLITVAKDVKIQVEFNPARVGAYRLIGYEKRKLAAEDFHNDAKDAGEMGAGHVVTALYELAPAGEVVPPAVDGLRYQQAPAAAAVKNDSKEAFVVKLRHKLPTSDVSTLREIPVVDSNKPYGEASEDFRFAAAVASYAMLLRDSLYKGNATYAAVMELAQAAKTWDPGEYRDEFVKLVAKAKQISGKP
ncbi:hypothetical protein BH11PLA2_BH11PLA2_49820 [soil metagenome]